MILKYLRLRKRASKDASGNSTTPRTGSLDLVNRGDRPFVRTPVNDEAGLLAENGAAVNSGARTDQLAIGGVCVDGTTFSIGNIGFQFNASDGSSVTNASAVPVKAEGTITLTANPADAGTITVGVDSAGANMVYRYKTTPVQAKDIKIGSDVAATIEHTISAINGTDGGFNTTPNNQVTAANGAGSTVVITAKYHGAAGDAVVFTESATNLTMDGSSTLGGTTAGVDQKYTAINIRATAAAAAKTGTWTAIAAVDDTVTIAGTVYTAIANSTTLTAGKFQIGSGGTSGTITNLIAAVMGTDGVNTKHATVRLDAGSGAGEVDATALTGGTAGNSLAIAESSSVFSWAGGATNLSGGDDSTQDESGTAIALAINNHADFSATYDATANIVTVTHALHGTVPNGYGYGEKVASAQVSWNPLNSVAGIAGTEGIQGAQREDGGFLYTCTGAVPANKSYTWKKTAIQNVTVAGFTTSVADSLAIPITHRYVDKTTGADAEALTLADGTPGQILTVSLIAVGGGSGVGTLTPTRKRGFTAVVLAQVKDTVTLEYVDDVSGWVVIGATGTAAPPVIT